MDPPPRPTPPSTTRSKTSAAPSTPNTLPHLEVLDNTKPHIFLAPRKCINDGVDVSHFLASKGYRDIGLFICQLNRALCPRETRNRVPFPVTQFTLTSPRTDPPSVKKLQQLLQRLDAIIDETPPDPGPRRFGNISFRTWHKRLEERIDDLLTEHIAPEVLDYPAAGDETKPDYATARDELKAYFLGGFGSSQRLDYGTGHELSFFAFLGCLWKLGAFKDGKIKEDTERSIVLGVLEPCVSLDTATL
jgi:serine/threonine-protein phosphatase 2A activator